MSIHTFGVHK